MYKIPVIMMIEFLYSQQFESTADVMAAMKGIFAEVLGKVIKS